MFGLSKLWIIGIAGALAVTAIVWLRFDAASDAKEDILNEQNAEIVEDVESAAEIDRTVGGMSDSDVDERLLREGWIRQGLLSPDNRIPGLQERLPGDEKKHTQP